MCKITDWIIMIMLTVASVIDFKKKEIPTVLLLVLGACSCVFRFLVVEATFTETLGGLLIGGFFFLVGKVTREAVGYGDCFIILWLGIYTGGFDTIQIVLTASMASAAFAIGYCMCTGWRRKHTLPFVPFLALAYLGVMLK